MEAISRNFGLLGGELDSTPHLEAAVKRLLDPEEWIQYCHRCQLTAAVTQQPVREAAPSN